MSWYALRKSTLLQEENVLKILVKILNQGLEKWLSA